MLQTTKRSAVPATLAANFLILILAMVLTVVSPLITQIARDFSLDKTQAGLLFTFNSVGFTAFILFGGIAADKFGKKIVLAITTMLMVVSLLLFSIVQNFIMANVVIIFIGGSVGVLESICNAHIAELNPAKKSLYINISQIFFGVGALAGPLLAGLLINAGLTWRNVYQLIGALTLVIGIFFMFVRVPPMPHAENEAISVHGFKKLVSNKLLWILCLCMFLYTGSEVGSWGWMSTFMMEKMQFTLVESSLSVGVFWSSMIVGRLICTSLLSRFKTKYFIIVLAFCSAAATAASGFVPGAAAAWAVIVLMGLSYSSIWPLIIAYGSERMKNSSGTIFALMVGSGGIGMSIIPAIMGFLSERISISFSMISPALFFAIVGIVFLFIDRIQAAEKKTSTKQLSETI